MMHLGMVIKTLAQRVVVPVSALLVLLSCSADELTNQYLRVRMLGVFEAPPEASERDSTWYEPVSHTFTLQNVFMFTTSDAGTELVQLYEGEDPADYRIIDRPQRIFRAPIGSSLVDKAVTRFVLVFANEVEGVSKFKSSQSLSLAGLPSCVASELSTSSFSNLGNSCVLEYAKGFTIGVGLNYDFVVKVQWKKTVQREENAGVVSESMQPPALAIELESQS